jgi:hypothetical protein
MRIKTPTANMVVPVSPELSKGTLAPFRIISGISLALCISGMTEQCCARDRNGTEKLSPSWLQ